jgi:outer membrane protein assembly factor BamB
VAGGLVYVGSSQGHFFAFSATGTTNCSGIPKTCKAVWSAPARGVDSSPAVVNGIVYVGSYNGGVYAFSAAGTTDCAGIPKVCSPLWIGPTGAISYSSPAVANGVVYIAATNGLLYAFSAAGTTNCKGTTTKSCQPLWTGATANQIDGSPAVANGTVYVSSSDGNLYAFSAAGATGCSGTPKTCLPIWTAPGLGGPTSPVVANGVVYTGEAGRVYGLSAAGTIDCTGTTPKRCRPLWTSADDGNATYASPAIANGVVYEAQWDSPSLVAYSP